MANLVDAHSEEQQCVVLLSIKRDLTRDLGALGQREGVISICDIVVQRLADEENEQGTGQVFNLSYNHKSHPNKP